jgi:hypothetical protein
MTPFALNIHGLERVRARADSHNTTSWTKIVFVADGVNLELTIFAESHEQAQALADAINSVPPRQSIVEAARRT